MGFLRGISEAAALPMATGMNECSPASCGTCWGGQGYDAPAVLVGACEALATVAAGLAGDAALGG